MCAVVPRRLRVSAELWHAAAGAPEPHTDRDAASRRARSASERGVILHRKLMNFILEMKDFVLTMMGFVLTMMDFVLKMMNFVLKLMGFVLKMLNFGGFSWRVRQ